MESEAENFLRSEKNIPWAVALGLVITWAIFITALFVYVRHVFFIYLMNSENLVVVQGGSTYGFLGRR